MRVSLITLQAIKNYGSVLQTYATQEFLQECGLTVEVVNYIRPDTTDSMLLETWTDGEKFPKKIIKRVALYPSFIRWKKVFDGFLKKNINLSLQTYVTPNDFKKFPIDADIYCVGSDQVWNSKWNKGIIGSFYLDYVPEKKRKVSFASSFGKSELEQWEKEQTKNFLTDFDCLSVREKTGVSILEDLGIHGATQLLDPTLLFDRFFWRKFSAKRIINENYLLIYQLNNNKDFDQYAKQFANENNLKLVRLCTRYDQFFKNGKSVLIPEVPEFVSLFSNASCVLTDSFHATAFSINLNIPFISIYPKEFSTRIESILRQMNLLDRHLDNFNKKIDIENIDFTFANEELEQKRNIARKFVEKSFLMR
ncbi:polysaccharide pyruvyl transferase family protein [Enterococcus malodoratus]|uniref:polysaccharide pyruvyl transferase family protein n=1 Tax=Enterococcus malodoratus TaxID=71451 RepID=UPI002073A2E7|nr:polysaccharide pyruvyl transferase family protein [Enterococcus malodoratus]